MGKPPNKVKTVGADTPTPLIAVPDRKPRIKWFAGLVVFAVLSLILGRSFLTWKNQGGMQDRGARAEPLDASVSHANVDKESQASSLRPADATSEYEAGAAQDAIRAAEKVGDRPIADPHRPSGHQVLGVQIPREDAGQSIVVIVTRSTFGPDEMRMLEGKRWGSLWLICLSAGSSTMIGSFGPGMATSSGLGVDRLNIRFSLEEPLDTDDIVSLMNARWQTGCQLEIRFSVNPEDKIALSM